MWVTKTRLLLQCNRYRVPEELEWRRAKRKLLYLLGRVKGPRVGCNPIPAPHNAAASTQRLKTEQLPKLECKTTTDLSHLNDIDFNSTVRRGWRQAVACVAPSLPETFYETGWQHAAAASY